LRDRYKKDLKARTVGQVPKAHAETELQAEGQWQNFSDERHELREC